MAFNDDISPSAFKCTDIFTIIFAYFLFKNLQKFVMHIFTTSMILQKQKQKNCITIKIYILHFITCATMAYTFLFENFTPSIVVYSLHSFHHHVLDLMEQEQLLRMSHKKRRVLYHKACHKIMRQNYMIDTVHSIHAGLFIKWRMPIPKPTPRIFQNDPIQRKTMDRRLKLIPKLKKTKRNVSTTKDNHIIYKQTMIPNISRLARTQGNKQNINLIQVDYNYKMHWNKTHEDQFIICCDTGCSISSSFALEDFEATPTPCDHHLMQTVNGSIMIAGAGIIK
jgi:hypothetical protein